MGITKISVSVLASLGINYFIFSTLNDKQDMIWELSESHLVPQQIDPSLLESIQIITEKKQPKKEKVVEIKNDIPVPEPKKIVKEEVVEETEIAKEEVKQVNKQKVIPPQTSTKIISQAKFKKPPPLQYPQDAIKKGLFGKVRIEAVISEFGEVSSIRIIESSGYVILDKAAIAWFKNIEFYPAATESGKVPSSVTQTISFKLEDAIS